ncbi:nucleotidyltransferase [uncultured Agrobacterium sp.]|uniref:nucleotidyltransferase domain-containing protein n=1 Tax=uncultured Agrobacterium sp. TaxID=157277 RepID=UPI0025E2C7FA|nr:nucleotidyltransferase [uncultured Agrobacterium sp.]
MITITKQAEGYLEALADELTISPSRYEQAVARYESLGAWLHREASTVRQYDPQVYSQGSFRLGTVIRPDDENGQYDVDSVCELASLTKGSLTQYSLKEMLRVEIESYRVAQSMRKPLGEGRRCWTLEYAEGAQFHMDIVPALPNGTATRLLLETRGLDAQWAGSAIAITDNKHPLFYQQTTEWPRSNPKGYANWFRSRMAVAFTRKRRQLAEALHASVESIPEYRVVTPLQQAIMILKRHRDQMFAIRKDVKPISVILTTLSAHAYGGEETIGQALVSILTNMNSFISFDGFQYSIPNPSDPLENFADKWAEYPERRAAFFEWLEAARRDFLYAAQQSSSQVITDSVALGIGRGLAERARDRAAPKPAASLLRPATVATSAAAAPSFPAQARIPGKPAGFGSK